jgi:hypothetical protein
VRKVHEVDAEDGHATIITSNELTLHSVQSPV